MSFAGGRWRFSFFDREPHAVFGEEVKTRVAIAFREESEDLPPRGARAEVFSGPLQKMTSRNRATFLVGVPSTQLGSFPIEDGIPRLGSQAEADLYRRLFSRHGRFRGFLTEIATVRPVEVPTLADSPCVFVSSTAYNFLNVFQSYPVGAVSNYALSESALMHLQCRDAERANLVHAILSSRLTFWVWRVLGDGFHVNIKFLEALPYDPDGIAPAARCTLSELGRELWSEQVAEPTISINKGRATFSFRPHSNQAELDRIDLVLLQGLALPSEFARLLREFVFNNAVVESTDPSRENVIRQFSDRGDLPGGIE
jgi:hypothetical protein